RGSGWQAEGAYFDAETPRNAMERGAGGMKKRLKAPLAGGVAGFAGGVTDLPRGIADGAAGFFTGVESLAAHLPARHLRFAVGVADLPRGILPGLAGFAHGLFAGFAGLTLDFEADAACLRAGRVIIVPVQPVAAGEDRRDHERKQK